MAKCSIMFVFFAVVVNPKIAESLSLKSPVPSYEDSNMDCKSAESAAFDGHHWFFKHHGCESKLSERKPRHRHRHSKPQTWVQKHWHKTENCKVPPPGESRGQSQTHEDVDLYNAFFCNKRNGTFVEMGALDGVRFSNTKFFDDFLGWSGALIEASPRSSSRLKENRKNPKNSIFSEGVCPEGQSSMNFIENDTPEVSGGTDAMSDSFKNKWHNGKRGKDIVISVPCRTLSAILKDHVRRSGVNHIDFFSLDVEGGEFQVLKSFDFEVPVNSWIIEMDGRDKEKDENVRQLLKEHGYVKSRVQDFSDRNEVWVNPELHP